MFGELAFALREAILQKWGDAKQAFRTFDQKGKGLLGSDEVCVARGTCLWACPSSARSTCPTSVVQRAQGEWVSD